jgi:hypothetical protein
MKARHILATLLAGLSLSSGVVAQAATYTLDFSGDICGASGDQACSNYAEIGQSYGDVAGLIDVGYVSRNVSTGSVYEPYLKYWESGYSDLESNAWGGAGASTQYAEITFAPAAGHVVTLLGFSFGDYGNRNNGSSVAILDAVTQAVLWDGGAFDPDLTALSFDLNVSSTNGLILRWGPDTYDTGIDNIKFAVTAVPEPESLALAFAGLMVAGMAARRQRRQG